VLGGLPADAHALWGGIEPQLHGVEHALMLPPLDAPLLAGVHRAFSAQP